MIGPKVLFSVVIPAKNEGAQIGQTVASLRAARNEVPFEVVVVDDGSSDDSCADLADPAAGAAVNVVRTQGVGAALARNLGAGAAAGEFLVFCDGHMRFPDQWLDRLYAALRREDVDAVTCGIASLEDPTLVGYGQTWNEQLRIRWYSKPEDSIPVPLLPGGCVALPARTFHAVGGFDSGIQTYGREDEEFSLRLWLLGYQGWVVPEVVVSHLFRTTTAYFKPREHWVYNSLRMAYCHFKPERFHRAVDVAKFHYGPLVDQLLPGVRALSERHREYCLTHRKRTDDEFMTRFGIPF